MAARKSTSVLSCIADNTNIVFQRTNLSPHPISLNIAQTVAVGWRSPFSLILGTKQQRLVEQALELSLYPADGSHATALQRDSPMRSVQLRHFFGSV